MSPNVLLMCKLLVLLLWQHGHFGTFAVPYLPFLPWLDVAAGTSPTLSALFRGGYMMSSALLLFNIAVRPAAFTLGTVLILSLVLSKPLFHNHLFLPACLFFLAACHRRGEIPRLLHWQFGIMYFGAFLNKVRDMDWWNGRFMDTFLTDGVPSIFYHVAAGWAPGLTIAIALSVAGMAAEALLALLFVLPRTQPAAVWGVFLFHGAIFVITCGARFGHFLEDLFIATLAFLAWPGEGARIRWKPAWLGVGRTLMSLLDWDRQLVAVGHQPESPGAWLEVVRGGRRLVNEDAVRHLVRYSASTYVLLYLADCATGWILPWKVKFAADVAILGCMMLILLPLSWRRRWT